MNDINKNLSTKLAGAGAVVTQQSFEANLQKWFKDNGGKIKAALGSDKEAKRFFALCVFVINRNPDILQCDPNTIYACIMQSAVTGSYPGPYKQCAWIVRNNNKRGCKELNWQPQYQGIANALYETGFVKKIKSNVVWEGDEFEYDYVTDEIMHVPCEDEKERGARKGVYCIIRNSHDVDEVTYLTAAQVARRRGYSTAFKFSDSKTFWKSEDPDVVDAMWKKTAIITASNLIPKTPKLAEMLEQDAKIEMPDAVRPPILNIDPELPAAEPQKAAFPPPAELPQPEKKIEVTIPAKEKELTPVQKAKQRADAEQAAVDERNSQGHPAAKE